MAAGQDIWGRALEIERRYGDKAEAFVGETLAVLPPSAAEEIQLWTEIGDVLRDLHRIRYPGSGSYGVRMAQPGRGTSPLSVAPSQAREKAT